MGRRRMTLRVIARRRFRRGGAKRLTAVPSLPTDLGHVGAISTDRLTTFAADLRHVLAIFADGGAALSADTCHMRSITADRLAALATDARHVEPITAHGLSPLAPRFSGLLRRKLVSSTFDVGGFAPFACDLALPLLRHRGETAPRSFRHDASCFPVPKPEPNRSPSWGSPIRLVRRYVVFGPIEATPWGELMFREICEKNGVD
jgi:hypothetical protein